MSVRPIEGSPRTFGGGQERGSSNGGRSGHRKCGRSTSRCPKPVPTTKRCSLKCSELSPAEFEAFIVALINKLPEIVPGLEHRVTRTRPTRDHGIDFFGMFKMPYPIDYEIEFLGEAKRYKTAITPNQVSRLVARLGRGQYGLYFTTSWYSEQTQKEIEADRHPVRLFCGQDIVNILRAGDCVSGSHIRSEWKQLALAEVEKATESGLKPASIW